MKAAYYDPNPVVILEHKGLYWSKVPGTQGATSVEPSEDYVLPFGKGMGFTRNLEARKCRDINYCYLRNGSALGNECHRKN